LRRLPEKERIRPPHLIAWLQEREDTG